MLFLVLWDIDGTLITSGGGMRAFARALHNVFGINDLLDDIDPAGRTDRWIMRQIFAKSGLPATEENFTRLTEGYEKALPGEMQIPGARLLPGVAVLLSAIRGLDNVGQGLLTGNLRAGARVKLASCGLWDYFAFGAFADDAEHRNELGPLAVRRAEERHGAAFAPHRVWIVGDTPHDIECARAMGANSLAVATGRHTLEDLAAHHPTALLQNLADADAFWRHTALRS